MRVIVVGNVTEDLVFSLPRLPRDGETLIASGRLSDMGGKGLNQALLLARAGCDACLVAAVGDDAAGHCARDLSSRELSVAALVTVAAPTDQSIVCVAENGENHIVSSAFAADALDAEAAIGAMGRIAPGDAVVVQGNLPSATTRAVLATARAAGAWTIANPSPIRWEWAPLLPLVDLTIVNRSELTGLAGGGDAGALMPETLVEKGTRSVLLTLGGDGARFLSAEGAAVQPAIPARVLDTAGAGDTFAAIFVAARHGRAPVPAALHAAARAAALTVSRRGTFSAFPTRAEIADCLAAAGAAA